jgi:hypothetical protein
MMRQMQVPSEWVATRDTGELPRLLGADLEPDKARQLQGTMAFVFPDLEVDDVRIFDTPGVVDWFAVLHGRIPHLIYFLAPQPMLGALEGLVLSLVPEDARDVSDGSPITLGQDELDAIARHLIACASFATDKGDDWEPIVDEFVEPLGGEAHAYLVGRVREAVG